ncbi:MAPEG family protein [Thalassotalea atypica]|uniref:MAPEG family protein n=1 Tax=Thalassotalea atypica TaxID=2054316 RepID=UPI00257395F4|nr:MAPEG family protein [Thalassotalea atypica]
MVSLTITGFYAGLIALLFMVLSMKVIRLRFSKKIGIGDGGDSELSKAIRVHANFAEYLPLALVLMAAFEVNGGSEMWLHVVGALLFVGRVLHAIGLSQSKGTSVQRAAGTLATQAVMVGVSVTLIINFIS